MQVAAGFIVILILKKILDHQLVELAIKKFEAIKLQPEDQKLSSILIISSRAISVAVHERIRLAAEKKFNRPISLVVKINKKINGGMIIQVNSAIVDYSVVGRLKEGRIIK